MSDDRLRELGADIAKNGLMLPIAVTSAGKRPNEPERYVLLDGRSRLDAMQLVGLDLGLSEVNGQWCLDVRGVDWTAPPPIVVHGNPITYVASVNFHRRDLTPEQRIEGLKKLIKMQPGLSARQIAQQAKVSPTTAAKAVRELEAEGTCPVLDTSTDTRGRKQPRHKPARTPRGRPVPVAGPPLPVSTPTAPEPEPVVEDENEPEMPCSFCGLPYAECRLVVSSDRRATICDWCAGLCVKKFDEREPTPQEEGEIEPQTVEEWIGIFSLRIHSARIALNGEGRKELKEAVLQLAEGLS
jgi:hypothetical protein